MPARNQSVPQIVTVPEPTRERVSTVGTLASAVGLIVGGIALFVVLVGGAFIYAVDSYFGEEGVRIAFVVVGVLGIYLLVSWQQGRNHRMSMRAFAEMGEVFNRREETDDAGEVKRIAANALPQIINGATQMGQTSARLGDDMFRHAMKLVAEERKNQPATPFDVPMLSLTDNDSEDDELE